MPNGFSDALSRAMILDGRRILRNRPAEAERLFETAARVAEQSTTGRTDFHAFLVGRALRQLGKYSSALPSIANAERYIEGVPMCSHELARAWLVRGTVLFKTDGLDESLHFLRLAINLFSAVGDQLRVARVRLVEGNVLFEQRMIDEARSRWLVAVPVFEASRDRHSTAMVWLNLGGAELELGRPDTAKEWLDKALTALSRFRSGADVILFPTPFGKSAARVKPGDVCSKRAAPSLASGSSRRSRA